MGTKWRNFSTHTATKFLVFVLVVAALAALPVQVRMVGSMDAEVESLVVDRYRDSDVFLYREAQRALFQAWRMLDEGVEPDGPVDYLYYITDGEQTYTNTGRSDEAFYTENRGAFYKLEQGAWTAGPDTALPSYSPGSGSEEAAAFVAFPTDYMETRQTDWEADRQRLGPWAAAMGACLMVALAGILFLMAATGRKPHDEAVHPARLDVVYSDVQVAFAGVVAVSWLRVISEMFFYGGRSSRGMGMGELSSMAAVGVATAVAIALCGVVVLSLCRKYKARKLLRHSLVFVAASTVYDFFKSLFDGRRFRGDSPTRSLFKRQWVFITASGLLVALTFLLLFAPPFFLLPPVLELMIIYWYVKGNNRTFEAIDRGFDESLWERMKSERMKIDLVTNVSHDLKTPLTSMVSYVELLSEEPDLSETARDYVGILEKKTERLKTIVSDLFDLAKSTSGDIALDMEQLDVKKLIEQTLGDMADDIEKSGRQVKVRLPEEPVMVVSDGKKLYRVFQNILDNALKYSLEGTRVYVELDQGEAGPVATVKNTAAYEMTFTAEEMLQRFSRGDRSRSTEGSGLGLSIAESFTRVCGGTLSVELDGDLFKVVVAFDQKNPGIEAVRPHGNRESKRRLKAIPWLRKRTG